MHIFFLVAILFVVVYLNRHMFGFGGTGCEWVGADTDNEDGSRKWMCNRHGTVVVTEDGTKPPDCEIDKTGG